METYAATTIRTGLSFGEAPRWHGGRLWYSDFYRHGVFSVAPDGSDERLEITVEHQPSGLGWMPDGSMLIVSMLDHQVLRYKNDQLTLHADISEHCGFWANDMVVNPDGVAYVGNFGFDLDVMLRDVGAAAMMASPPPATNLVVLDPKGKVLQVVPDMQFPNGMVIAADGGTLIVAETMSFRLSAFDIANDGTLSNRRVFAQLDFVAADGICLDKEGQVWVANALAPQCIRVAEGAQITAQVDTALTAFACMLGGDDHQDLYVMTSPTSSRFELDGNTPAAIERAHVGVPGAGLP